MTGQVDCSTIPFLGTIVFSIGGNEESPLLRLELSPAEYIIGKPTSHRCFTALNVAASNKNHWIFGLHVMRAFYTVYHYEYGLVGIGKCCWRHFLLSYTIELSTEWWVGPRLTCFCMVIDTTSTLQHYSKQPGGKSSSSRNPQDPRPRSQRVVAEDAIKWSKISHLTSSIHIHLSPPLLLPHGHHVLYILTLLRAFVFVHNQQTLVVFCPLLI